MITSPEPKGAALRARIVSHARTILDEYPDRTLSTFELACAIMGREEVLVGSDRIARVLFDCAPRELVPYATKGDPQPGKGYNSGRLVCPWRWHAKKDRPAVDRPANMLADILQKLEAMEQKLDTLLTRQ